VNGNTWQLGTGYWVLRTDPRVLPWLLFVNETLFYSPRGMKEKTETLAIADRAPDFTLSAANREGTVSLSQLLQRGPVILEFLRGTW
jgi:hypothetical protein